jgi:MFS family permease
VVRRIGLAGAIMFGLTVFCLGTLLIPLAPANLGVAMPMLIVAGLLMSTGGQICSVNVITLRQRTSPDHLQGRVNGSFRFLGYGLAPLGALAGGLAGAAVGPRLALFVVVAVMAVGPLVVWCSAVRRVRALPGTPTKEAAR